MAAAKYQAVAAQLEERVSALNSSQPAATAEQEGANARQNLFDLGDVLAHDATKFHFLFQQASAKAAIPGKDALGMLAHVEPSLDKFCAWCNVVAGENKAIKREVALLGGELLVAFKGVLNTAVATKFSAPLPNEAAGRVMKAAEALKRLPKNEAAAVQRQIFRDAASVKTIVQDLEEMLKSQGGEEDDLARTAARMEGMDVGTADSSAGASDFADLMNMDVSLEGEELLLVQSCLCIISSCLGLQKAACRVLIAPTDENAEAPQVSALEDLAQASVTFTRAAEDLGALCILDPSECKEQGETAVGGLRQAAAALRKVAANRSGVEPHLSSLTSLVDSAEQAFAKI